MARKKNGRRDDLWEDDFLDISSDSGQPVRESNASRRASPDFSASRQTPPRPPRPASGSRRPPPAGQQKRRPEPGRRPSPDRPANPRGRPPGRGPEARRNTGSQPNPRPRKRQKKKMSNGARRVMVAVTVLVMVVVTALLAIFLLFKVSEIQVTGDPVVPNQDILDICGYEIGDNLFFLTTKDKEEKLEQEQPYIEKAEIKRHLPGTLEINITGAKVASCVSSSGSWLYVSGGDKILEQKAEPKEGVLQVVGLTPVDPKPGEKVKVEDPAVQEAYDTILAKIVALDASTKFTKLDLSDLYDIRLVYEDRVEFKLGNTAELDYKLEFGYDIVSDPERIGPQEKGVLDLSYAPDVKRADFTEGTESKATASQASSSPGNGVSSDPSSSEDGRGGEIPDAPFTGDSDETGGTGDMGDTGDIWTDGTDDGTGDGATDGVDGTGETGNEGNGDGEPAE